MAVVDSPVSVARSPQHLMKARLAGTKVALQSLAAKAERLLTVSQHGALLLDSCDFKSPEPL
jgi:hypothetical protein